ncbi:MAG: phage virion morphogenesis protein [Afipia sp.]
MTGVRMQLDQDAALKELAGYIERARNPRGMFENIGMSLVTSTQHRFEQGKGPDGNPWPPSIRALATGGKTLIGPMARLMRSVTFNATATALELGSNVIYAAIHQLGGIIRQAARTAVLHFKTNKRTGKSLFSKPGKADRARKAEIGALVIRMPARPFIGLDDDDNREILRIAEDWLIGEGATP